MPSQKRQPELRIASLAEISERALPSLDTVTAVIHQTVRRHAIEQFEAWVKKIVPVAARFPGHRGVSIIRPTQGGLKYTVAIHFDSIAHAQDWFLSSARRQLMEEVAPLLESKEEVETRQGLEFWFRPDVGQLPPKRYKQFLVTLSVILPLTLAVPELIHRLFSNAPKLANYWSEHFLSAAVVVALMVYVIMPRYTRWLSRWLYN